MRSSPHGDVVKRGSRLRNATGAARTRSQIEWGETHHWDRFDKDEMQRLRNTGLTGEDIAARLGCAVATVYAYTQPSAGEPKNDSEHKTVNKYTPGKRYGDYVF